MMLRSRNSGCQSWFPYARDKLHAVIGHVSVDTRKTHQMSRAENTTQLGSSHASVLGNRTAACPGEMMCITLRSTSCPKYHGKKVSSKWLYRKSASSVCKVFQSRHQCGHCTVCDNHYRQFYGLYGKRAGLYTISVYCVETDLW